MINHTPAQLERTPDLSSEQPLPARVAPIDRGKSDYLKLLNMLRARRRDLASGRRSGNTLSTNRVFVDVEQDSPLFTLLGNFCSVLKALKGLIKCVMSPEPPAEVLEEEQLQWLSRSHLLTVLNLTNRQRLDFNKEFSLVLHIEEGSVYVLNIHGVSNAGQAATCRVPDYQLRFINLVRTLNEMGAGLSGLVSPVGLVMREDCTLSLQSFLSYYGFKIANEADRRQLTQAIESLAPKESRVESVSAGAARLFTVPEQPRFVLDTAQIYTFRERVVDAHGTDDYQLITAEINNEGQATLERYRTLLNTWTHFGASLASNENALLALLQQAGGISVKLTVFDSDGERNIYHEQHTVNPWRASDLAGYFATAQAELSAYMIGTVQYEEGEGAINIDKLVVAMVVPNIILHSHDLQPPHIEAFAIRSTAPPFLYLDPLSKGAYATINARFAAVANELRKVNWDSQKSILLNHAAWHLMRYHKDDVPALKPAAHEAARLMRLNEAVNIYYSVVAKNIEAQQQLKVILQPTQPETASRAICRYLTLEEQHWGVIAQAVFDIRYEAGWKNTGTFVKHSKTAGYRTLLSVVYDESLRREIALADNRDELLQALAQALHAKTATHAASHALQEKLGALFDANLAFVSNSQLPAELTRPKHTFEQLVETYVIKAVGEYRSLEAERIVLTSSDAAARLDRSSRGVLINTDKAFHCAELLTSAEQDLLKTRTQAFAAFLRARANNDDIQDLSTSAQHVLQLVHQVGGLIPVVGNFINLGFDIYSGDTEAIALDGVNIVGELLCGFRSTPARALGTLMLQGNNIWMLAQQTQALNASIKANDYPASVLHLGFIMLGMHSALQCGSSIVHGLTPAPVEETTVLTLAAEEEGEPTGATAEHTGPTYEVEGAAAVVHESSASASAHNPYWAITDGGQISVRQAGRKVVSVDWNGNAIVEGGARAVLLGGINETLYMLNGVAHRAVMGVGGPELRPLHMLDIEAGQWIRNRHGADQPAQFSRFAHTEAFPSGFSGRPVRRVAASNAVSWYDNCVTALDDLSTQVTDLEGKHTQRNVAIGVVEQKYITTSNGHFELLEHAGTAEGKTTFVRVDGSRWQVAVELPATPHYRSHIQARIVAAQGVFVTVEVSGTLQGLVGKKTVAGVIATLRKGGGQELVIEVDRGVHYRGTLAAADALTLLPGEVSPEQQPVALSLQKISPEADPKRASPDLYRDEPQYRDSLAHDDFALELYYGAKAANEAYARNAQWVEQNVTALGKIKAQLPPPIRTVENPFYLLDTPEEMAILFAPRNQAALANTLLGKTIEWGSASSTRSLALGQKALRRLQVKTALLGADEAIPLLPEPRRRFARGIKQALGERNLLLAEVENQAGEKACFAHTTAEHVAVSKGAADEPIHVTASGSIIDHIEAHYPDPSQVKSIVVLSVDDVSEMDARRIFLSSQRGYTYESVTALVPEPSTRDVSPAEVQLDIPDVQYVQRAREVKVANASVDLSGATFVDSGARRGSYQLDGRDYVKLDNGKIYRAEWDSQYTCYVLLPPEGKVVINSWIYPMVRYTGGSEFTLINRPGLKGGHWKAEVVGGVRIKNYPRSITRGGRLTAAQRSNNSELQVHHEHVHRMTDQTLHNGKLNVPGELFGLSHAHASGYVTLKSRVAVPESCISSTEFLISKYAGGVSEFDYAGEPHHQATPVIPNVEVVALHNGQETTLNVSTSALDGWIAGEGYSDYFTEADALPDIGEGIAFIERHGTTGELSSEYPFHFMFVAGKVLDHNGAVTAVLATDLSEPPRNTANEQLLATRNWNVQVFRSVDDMRGAPGPNSNYYAKEHYYSARVRPLSVVEAVSEAQVVIAESEQ